MEYPCSPFRWADDAPDVHPVCTSCCYIPKRHRGFFRDQINQLPVYDEVMKDLVCHCHHDDHHNDNEDSGIGVEDETSDAYINASSVCPSVWNPQTSAAGGGGGAGVGGIAPGKFITTSPTTSRSNSSASGSTSFSSGYSSGSGSGSPSSFAYGKNWRQPWTRFDSGFQPNINWPHTGYWRNFERSKPHQSFTGMKPHQQREPRFVPSTTEHRRSYRDVI